MPSEEEDLKTCGECGAVIYPEMLEQNAAGHWGEMLLCPHCLREKSSQDAPRLEDGAVIGQPAEEEDAPPVALAVGLDDEDDDTPADQPSAAITYGGGGITFEQMTTTEGEYQRSLLKGSAGATRCRIFHSKINDPSMLHMVKQINEWADASDDIEIKFATSTIGIIEGKHADPHLIVTVFY